MQSLTYVWDGYGNLTEREDTNQSLTETFGYDDLNRLTSSMVTNPAANGPTLGFGYDAMGNIETKTLSGVTSTYTYDPNHPYAVDNVTNVNGGTYTASYDADGDMVTRDGAAITWTPANLPASIASSLGSSTFNYGPEGSRYYQAQTFNGVTTDTTYVAGGLFEVVASTSSTEFRHDIVADGQVIAVHTITAGGAASTSYLHYDQLGSMDTITNATGSVIQSMSFDAFGNRRIATSWDYGVSQNTLATMNDYTNRGYTDQEQLDNLSLVDMNGRVYDPTVGRFISADPTMPNPLYSQAFDRYSYTYDSPLEFTDPSGFGPRDWNWYLLGAAGTDTVSAALLGIGSATLGVSAIVGTPDTAGLSLGLLPVAGLLAAGSAIEQSDAFEEGLAGLQGYNTPFVSPYSDSSQDQSMSQEAEMTEILIDSKAIPTSIGLKLMRDYLIWKAAQNPNDSTIDNKGSSEPTSSAGANGSGGGSGGNSIGGGPDTLTFPSGCGCGSYTGPYESAGNNVTIIHLNPVIVTGKSVP